MATTPLPRPKPESLSSTAEGNAKGWKAKLKRASFRGVVFYTDVDGLTSGRRIALHEYPKKDKPYAEDMGLRAVHHTITGYLIASNKNKFDHLQERQDLIHALDKEGPGVLVHPLLEQMKVVCMTYSVQDMKDRGGYATFEMQFVEAGEAAEIVPLDSPQNVGQMAEVATKSTVQSFSSMEFSGSQFTNPLTKPAT